MAGNLPVPQGVELKLVWNLGPSPAALTILHARDAANFPLDQTGANAIDTGIKTAFTASGLAALVHPTVTLHHIEIRKMASNSDPWWVGANAAVPGTGTGDPLPAATSLVVTLRTGLRGRSYNGRVYVWGWTEAANDTSGGATAGASTAAIAFISQTGSFINSAPYGMSLSILSRFATIPPATEPIERNPPVLNTVTGILTRDLRWDVQRRRALPGI